MPRVRVITERDVRHAVKEGRREIDARSAVVTPSARDVAIRSGVTLSGEASPRNAALPGRARLTEQLPPSAKSPGARASTAARALALGADHGGLALKNAVAAHLRELGHSVTDHGTVSADAVDYPDYAMAVARAVASGAAQVGIMVDGAGIGSCMVANKVPGVRAAMCYDVTTAQNAREHNNANLLTLGGGLIGPRLAFAIVDAFLDTEFGGGRHSARVAKIDALDGARLAR